VRGGLKCPLSTNGGKVKDMIDYDKLEKHELAKYKPPKPAKQSKPKPVPKPKPRPQVDTKRRMTDKQIKSLVKKNRKPAKSKPTFFGIKKKSQNKTLSRKSRIRLI
jgi:hypothetical protein